MQRNKIVQLIGAGEQPCKLINASIEDDLSKGTGMRQVSLLALTLATCWVYSLFSSLPIQCALLAQGKRPAVFLGAGISSLPCSHGLRKQVREHDSLPATARRALHWKGTKSNLIRQGGFGAQAPQPPGFMTGQIDDAVEFFSREGYVLILEALSTDELIELNHFCEQSQRARLNDWGLKEQSEYQSRQGLMYAQPLLDYPELDKFVRHEPVASIVTRILGEPRHEEFNFRECPKGVPGKPMKFHIDQALDDRFNRSLQQPVDYVNCITYLSDVTEETPAFCVVPRSGRCATMQDARNALGSDYIEQPLYGPAGTCILADSAIFHTRLDGTSGRHPKRRTLHQYFSRGGWIGDRPPSPALTRWNLIPPRLAFHDDPVVRDFFSSWTVAMKDWASSNFSEEWKVRCHLLWKPP